MVEQQRHKLARLVNALDDCYREVASRAARTRAGIASHSFAPYHAYRASIDEYYALAAVIRASLDASGAKEATRIQEQLLARERLMLKLMIRASMDFFFALSAIPILPFGTRECFAQELQSMSSAHQRLRAPEHEGKLPADLEQDLEVSEEILAEVMHKAPALISFDPVP
ncbi:MAG TPA: hypothetical protein VM689_10345 [Aliidongia sp.]|nr:hypothetical protein [Aliidongia sp.]